MTSKNPYRTAGMGGVYVEREADIHLRRELSDNRRFPLISAPSESGKTSLIRHTIESLDPAGFCVLSVDLSRLRLGTPTQFMGELLGAIAKEGDFDQREILPDNPEDTILAWLGTFPQRLVIFFDNCEVLERPEICDAVFGKLRLLFNIRNENEEFQRLQIFLAGAVSGRQLIPIHLQAPFGIGNEIQLRPFNAEQVDALAWHLSASGVAVGGDVGSRLTHHSGGLPFLCQQVLSSLWEDAVIKGTPIDTAEVDHAVDDLIERAPQIEHFASMFRTFSSDQDLLDAFHRLCRGQSVAEEMLARLTLTGLCEEDLPYRSAIYERVFGRGGPLALPAPIGQRATVQVAIIAGPDASSHAEVEDTDAIEVDPDEDSGFLVLSEPPPPAKPQDPRPQSLPGATLPEEPPLSTIASIASIAPIEPTASSVPSAPSAPSVPIAAESAPGSAKTPTYSVPAVSQMTPTKDVPQQPGPQSTKTPTYGVTAAPVSTKTPTYAASLGTSLPPSDGLASKKTPTYLGGTPTSPPPSERTPTYAGGMLTSAPASTSTPKYPGTTGSMPAIPALPLDAGGSLSNRTPLYSPSTMPPIPSQRTPTYPAMGQAQPGGEGLEARLLRAERDAGDLDDRPTQLQPTAPRSETQELRQKIDTQILLSAELDLFCSTYFPHVARLFNSPLSRTEKTDLLLAHADRSTLRERLKDWSKQRREAQPDAYSVSSAESIAPLAPEVVAAAPVASPVVAPPTPPVAPPPIPDRPAEPPAVATVVDAAAEVKSGTSETPEGFKPPSSAVMQVGIGLVLANRYFLTSEIGQGAVATMWNAYDRIKDEQVAIKILHGAAADNPQLVERFWRSAQQMGSLSHPTVVGVLNKPREENGTHYVVFELQAGGNLRQWVLGGKLTRMQLMRTLQRLGAALSYAHEKKVFHRDIKPTNILFDAAGHARLTDFGMVWPSDTPQKQESRTDRTVYMAPEEQAGGQLGDPRSDVYSIGMCALYALLGKELTPALVMDRGGLIDQLDAPPPLKAVLLRAVAPNPNDRFPSVAEFCRALEFDAPALPGMVNRSSLPGMPGSLTRTNPGMIAPGMRQSSPQMPVMAPLSRTNPPINPSLTRTNPGLFGGQAPPLTSPAKSVAVRTTGPQAVAAGLRTTNPPMPGLTRTAPPPMLRTPTAEEEIQPPPGRSPGELAEYAIDTERVRAVTSEAMVTRNPNSVMQPLPMPPPSRQWPLMIGFGVLVLAGGIGLGTYLVNTNRKPVVAVNDPGRKAIPGDPNPTVAVRPGEPSTDEVFVATPIIPVKPGEVQPGKNRHDSTKHGDAKSTVVAMAKPTAGAEKEGVEKAGARPSLMKGALKPEPVPGPEQKPLIAKVEPAKVVAAEKPEPAKVVAAAKTEPAKVVAAAKTEPAKVVAAAKTEPAKVVAAAKPEPAKVVAAAKTEPAKVVAAAKTEPAKVVAAAKPEAAKPVAVAKAVVAVKPTPVAKPEPLKLAVKPTPAIKPGPFKPQVAAVKPTPVQTAAAATPEGQAALRDAQQAYVRGDRQQALAMALGVTRRGGEDAASAWRFVGGAACSSRQAALATTAYRNLRSPDARRTLVDLCQRNGLPFAGGQFTSD
ncbi:MAG: protein kinase [Myxococcales bacterium]|nr:protein kinase [Myxococcales bacterium]